jgi:hypothetical protein
MTRKQAQLRARHYAKLSVKTYFNREGLEQFNWKDYGLNIIKMELYHARKLYQAHWDSLTKQWTVIFMHGNKIVEY